MKKSRYLLAPVMAVIVVILIIGGIALADAYRAWEGAVNISVPEPLSVTSDDPDFDADTLTWTVALSPGETKELSIYVSNSSSESLSVTAIANIEGDEDVDENMDIFWDEETQEIAGEDIAEFILTVTAYGSAAPGTYSFSIGFERE